MAIEIDTAGNGADQMGGNIVALRPRAWRLAGIDARREGGALAAAALMSTMRRTPKAAKRCAAWMDRALAALDRSAALPQADAEVLASASEHLTRVCAICGLCRSIGGDA
jgi:hypothetical protein